MNRGLIPPHASSQRSGGKLEEREARSVLIGIGPPVPPPQMAGLEQLKTPVNQLAPKVARQRRF